MCVCVRVCVLGWTYGCVFCVLRRECVCHRRCRANLLEHGVSVGATLDALPGTSGGGNPHFSAALLAALKLKRTVLPCTGVLSVYKGPRKPVHHERPFTGVVLPGPDGFGASGGLDVSHVIYKTARGGTTKAHLQELVFASVDSGKGRPGKAAAEHAFCTAVAAAVVRIVKVVKCTR